MINIQNKLFACFALIIILLHETRNLSNLYFLFYVLSFIFLVKILWESKISLHIYIFFLSVCFLIAYAGLLSFLTGKSESILTGMLRMFFILPFIIICFSLKNSFSLYKMFLVIILIFIIISGLSITYQQEFGAISWFDEESERAGLGRFSTLAGSLTAFGSLTGVGIVISFLLFKSATVRILFVLLFLYFSIISLQKMGLASFFLGLMAVMAIYKNNLNIKSIFVIVFFSLLFINSIFFLNHLISENLTRSIEFAFLVFTEDAHTVGDVNFFQSLLDRAIHLPGILIDFWGSYVYLLGVGVFGASGALGYPDFPMAHNLIFETLAVFGLPIGVLILGFIFYASIASLYYMIASDCAYLKTFSSILLLMVLTSLFTGGLFFHPVNGSIFWVSLIFVFRNIPKNYLFLKL